MPAFEDGPSGASAEPKHLGLAVKPFHFLRQANYPNHAKVG